MGPHGPEQEYHVRESKVAVCVFALLVSRVAQSQCADYVAAGRRFSSCLPFDDMELDLADKCWTGYVYAVNATCICIPWFPF